VTVVVSMFLFDSAVRSPATPLAGGFAALKRV